MVPVKTEVTTRSKKAGRADKAIASIFTEAIQRSASNLNPILKERIRSTGDEIKPKRGRPVGSKTTKVKPDLDHSVIGLRTQSKEAVLEKPSEKPSEKLEKGAERTFSGLLKKTVKKS